MEHCAGCNDAGTASSECAIKDGIMTATSDISRERIAATEAVIRPHIRRTPLIQADLADFGLPAAPVIFKLEMLQHSGSFKARGAFANLLLQRSRHLRRHHCRRHSHLQLRQSRSRFPNYLRNEPLLSGRRYTGPGQLTAAGSIR